MVKVHMMKAYEGDFIWLSYGDSEKEYHLLIDGGIKECRERYADVIRSISAKGESIEAIILTHIDCDHIMKGLMQALKDNPSLRFAVITGCLKIARIESIRLRF